MCDFTHPELIGQKRFREIVVSSFPAFKEGLEAEGNLGLLHLEMAAFREFTQRFINQGEFDNLGSVYTFLEAILEHAHPDVLNAIYVSFLENFDFEATENDRKAKSLLPTRLAIMLKELDEHWEQVIKWKAESLLQERE